MAQDKEDVEFKLNWGSSNLIVVIEPYHHRVLTIAGDRMALEVNQT